jgi:hypothetical protein
MFIRRNSWMFVLVLSCSLMPLAGCGGKYKMAPVSGTITLDGKPLADATVSFTPQATGSEAPASTGKTDQSGKYTLSLVSDETNGAIIGNHRVVIAKSFESSSDIATPDERAKASLPDHNFSFEVKPGQNKADFNLEPKKGKK